MADIVSLDAARRKRSELGRALAEHASMHPSLRWISGGDDAAHRRTRLGVTACGLSGPLTLAQAADELCSDCYPRRSAVAP